MAEGYIISAMTQAEILLGLALLPAGKCCETLSTQAHAMFAENFVNAIYPLNYMLSLANQSLAISTKDGLIAATALRHGC